MIKISIAPVPCPRPRIGRWGAYYPDKYKKYKKELAFLLADLVPFGELDILFVMKRPTRLKGTDRQIHTKKPDLDNLLKGFMDGLPFDDKLIHTVKASKVYSAKGEDPHILMSWRK